MVTIWDLMISLIGSTAEAGQPAVDTLAWCNETMQDTARLSQDSFKTIYQYIKEVT
jgi:hypothetical protein